MAKFKITGLPKAQIGGKSATSLLYSPYEQGMFSNSLHPEGSADPSFILGVERSNLFPTWGYNNDVRSSLSGQVQFPYAMNQAPGVKGRWTTEYSPNAGERPVQFTTTGQLEGGYNPSQGFNASMMAWPHIWGSNVDVSRWRNPERYYPGAFRAGIGPQLGGSYMTKAMTTSGDNDIATVSGQTVSKTGLGYGGRGYLEYTPTDWLKLRLDAQGMFDPLTKKVAEGTQEGSAAPTEQVKWKFSPGVQLSATVPIKALTSNKKKASEEKIKIDAANADANTKDIMVEAPVMTGPGIDWDYRQKQQGSGAPVGHLPGYEPETGRQLTEEEVMQRYGQGPRLAKGGSSSQLYIHPDRMDAVYKKDSKGKWLIKSNDTSGKFVPLKDPDGKRAANLNKNAVPAKKAGTNPAADRHVVGATPYTYVNPRDVPDRPGEDIGEIFDPTGLSSWDDISRSYSKEGMSPNTALEIFGAIPLLGKLKWAGEAVQGLGKTFAVTGRQKRNAKVFGNTMKGIAKYGPGIGRATDAYQAYANHFANNNLGPKYQDGGTANDIYLDLDDNEIEQYKLAGYVVEDLPQAQKGGEQIYTYADRPEATYKKDAKGNWLISLPSTDGKYVPIKDTSGKRAGELNEKAKPVEKPTLMTKAYSSVKDFNRLPEEDKKARASMYAYNESMRQKGYVFDPFKGHYVPSNIPSAANNYNDGAIQSADWFWTLPIALPAITQTLGGIGAMSLPGMASIPGATVGNLVNSGFIASSLMGAPGNVMDWYNVIQGKKDWKDAAMDSADIALGFIGSGAGWKSLFQDAKTLRAPSKIVSKTRSTVGNVIKPGVLSAKPNQYSIAGQRGAAGKTGLDASHVEDVRKKAIVRLQSDDYLKKRMANTGETEEQVRADVNKIISEAEDAKYNLNAYLSVEGMQTPKGLQNLWRYPTVDISKNAENPITTLIHENNHLYSPAGYKSNMAPLIRGWDNPNIASVPFGKKRGVYSNYPTLGVTDDIGEYEAKEWEQQVRHLNARDQIISANNLAEDAKVTPEMVEKFGQDWFKRMKTEGAVGEDYDLIWNSELRNVRETLAKEKGFANTAELEKNLTEADKAAFLKEVRKRWSEKVADVLNSAWMGVPAVIGAGALGAGATDGEFKKGGFPKNMGKLKKFIR